MRSPLSIKVLMPVLLLMPPLVVSVVILVVTSLAAARSAERQAYDELAQVQAASVSQVRAYLATPARASKLNLDLMEQGTLDPADPAGWRPVLLAQARAFPGLSGLTWGSEAKTAVWVARYGQVDSQLYYAELTREDNGLMREYPIGDADRLPDEPSSRFEIDPTTRPWYTTAVAAGRPAWSEPYPWVGDAENSAVTIGLSYSVPYPGGDAERVGVFSADLNLSDISRFLAELEIIEGGQCYIIDRKGRLIASSTDIALADASQQMWLAREAPDPVMRAIETGLQAEPNGDPGISRTKVSTVDFTLFTTRTPVGEDVGLDWTVVTAVPESVFLAEAQRTQQRTLILCAVVILFTLLAGVAVARWLNRPVLALQGHVEKIGGGDLDSRLELRATTEFEHVCQALNKMSADLKDRMELRRSLATAMQVQQSLLPQQLPTIKGLDLAGSSNYCDQTGGDYYDFLDLSDLSDHSVVVVVGDVMGHGIAAAMLMATARGVLRSRSCEPGTTGELMGHLNQQLAEVTAGKRFMTMIMASIDSNTRQMRWAGAGHDAPFIYDPTTDTFLEIEGGGFPLGVMVDEQYEEYVTDPLPPGTVIVFLTDGVFEARDRDEQMYGKDRVLEHVRTHARQSARAIADAIEQDLDQFQGETRQEDDITLVVVKLADR